MTETGVGAPATASPGIALHPRRWWLEVAVVLTLSVGMGTVPTSPNAEQVGAWIAWPLAATVLRELGQDRPTVRATASWLSLGGLAGFAWAVHAGVAGPASPVGGPTPVMALALSAPALAAIGVGVPLAITRRTGPAVAGTAGLGVTGAVALVTTQPQLGVLGGPALGLAMFLSALLLVRSRRTLTGHDLLRSSWALLLLAATSVVVVVGLVWRPVGDAASGIRDGLMAAFVIGLPVLTAWLVAARRLRPVLAPLAVTTLVAAGAVLATAVYGVVGTMLPAGAGRPGFDGTRVAVTVLVAAALVPTGRVLYLRVLELSYGAGSLPKGAQALTAQLASHALVPGSHEDLVLEELGATVAGALRLPGATIVAGPRPEESSSTTVLDLPLPSDRPAWLVVRHRRGREPLSPTDLQTLDRLLPSLTLVVHATRLAADVERSRALEAASREEERDRLRRDLHDGLGPLLAGLAMHAHALARQARDPVADDARLLAAGLADARAGLRRVVDGLAPVADDRSPTESLIELLDAWARAAATAGIVLTTSVGTIPRDMDPAVLATAHMVAGEALANAVRHARATHIDTRVFLDHDLLVVEVRDDGVGVPATPIPGVGLASMAERARAQGGTLDVASADEPDRGTLIRLALPLRGTE